MLSWHLQEFGGDYVFGEVPTPEVGPGDVRVRVVASALNHIDHWVTQGRPKPPAYPHVTGADGAGIIESVGSEVTRWSVGDEVVCNVAVTSAESVTSLGVDSVLDPSLQILGEHRWGAHGEFVVLPARNVVARPPHRSWEECAAYGTGTGTGWRMLRRARIEAGSKVLVTGIGGGVALGCFNVARHLGAEIYVTSRDANKRKRAIELGAAGAFDSTEPFPVKVDIVADSIGPAIWENAVRALKPGGRFVTCGATSGQTLEVAVPRLFFKQHELIGSTLCSYEEFDFVTELVAAGMAVDVDEVVPLEEYPLAVERIRQGTQFGKIVLTHSPI